nr:MAG TPA: hypothetical protein [Caudoviricetes sp.]
MMRFKNIFRCLSFKNTYFRRFKRFKIFFGVLCKPDK